MHTHIYSPYKVVTQGSVLGSLLYIQHTADLPTTPETTVSTFVDDTAIGILDSDQNPTVVLNDCKIS